MKTIITVIALVLSLSPAWAQTNQPDENSVVHKEYDENGNLIKYDSTFVQRWSSDTTLTFPYNNFQYFGEDISDLDQVFREFFGDSARFNRRLPNDFFSTPFSAEDFFEQFSAVFSDSAFHSLQPHFPDSVWNRHFDFNLQTHPGFNNWQDMQRHFEQQMRPRFNTPEQHKEWEQLMERQRKEQREFLDKLEKER